MKNIVLEEVKNYLQEKMENTCIFRLNEVEGEDRSVGIFGDLYLGEYIEYVPISITLKGEEELGKVFMDILNKEEVFIPTKSPMGIIAYADPGYESFMGERFEQELEGYFSIASYTDQRYGYDYNEDDNTYIYHLRLKVLFY